MQSKLFHLQSNDFVRGAITAVFAGIVVALGGIVSQPGFDVFMVDWGAVFHLAVNVSVATFIAYCAKNFLTNSQGAVLGIPASKPQ